MAKKQQGVKAVERKLLHELKELTGRQFVYEDFWCGMVPFDCKLTELQTGPPVPFSELTWREQADVLREFIHWGGYPERAWNDEYRIQENIAAGMRTEHWLEGTSLRETFRLLAEGKTPPPPPQCPEITEQDLAKLSDASVRAVENPAPAKTEDGKVSLQDLRKESVQLEKHGQNEKCKSQEKER